jgi:hypothetical protein
MKIELSVLSWSVFMLLRNSQSGRFYEHGTEDWGSVKDGALFD